jgi:hypothetical protein
MSTNHIGKVFKDFPVKSLRKGSKEYNNAKDLVTCGTCGRSWDDAVVTGWTPAPSARCPFEYFHHESILSILKRTYYDVV